MKQINKPYLDKLIHDLEQEQEEIQIKLKAIDEYSEEDGWDIVLRYTHKLGYGCEVGFTKEEAEEFLCWKREKLVRENKSIENILNKL